MIFGPECKMRVSVSNSNLSERQKRVNFPLTFFLTFCQRDANPSSFEAKRKNGHKYICVQIFFAKNLSTKNDVALNPDKINPIFSFSVLFQYVDWCVLMVKKAFKCHF